MILFGNVISIKNVVNILFTISLIYFSYLMVLITLQYIPIHFDVAFLRIKQYEIQFLHYKIAFFTHVYTSIFVLILAIFQLQNWIRVRYSSLHKYAGKLYVLLILLFSAPSGLVMGYYANGGLYAQISFVLLSILWFYFTFKGYQYAKQNNWQLHQNYMFRSIALTFSAISLRLFKWIIASFFHLPPMDIYVIIAWLGWVVNLIIVEVIIYRKDIKY